LPEIFLLKFFKNFKKRKKKLTTMESLIDYESCASLYLYMKLQNIKKDDFNSHLSSAFFTHSLLIYGLLDLKTHGKSNQ
jgi:hypothetical protein